MNIGDYVRTKKGEIGKIIGYIDEPTDYYFNCYVTTLKANFTDTYITEYDNKIKSSSNIIDLIEEGDYVNGYLIDYIDSERRYLRSERPYREDSTLYKDLIEKGRNYNQSLHFFAEDIKSIVTHEQFESMEYKL